MAFGKMPSHILQQCFCPKYVLAKRIRVSASMFCKQSLQIISFSVKENVVSCSLFIMTLRPDSSKVPSRKKCVRYYTRTVFFSRLRRASAVAMTYFSSSKGQGTLFSNKHAKFQAINYHNGASYFVTYHGNFKKDNLQKKIDTFITSKEQHNAHLLIMQLRVFCFLPDKRVREKKGNLVFLNEMRLIEGV